MRHGIALTVTTETRSLGEMRVLKREESNGFNWPRTKRAIHVVDRAFIDGRFWVQRFKLYDSTVITRMKSVLKYSVVKKTDIAISTSNEGVLYDRTVTLQSGELNTTRLSKSYVFDFHLHSPLCKRGARGDLF